MWDALAPLLGVVLWPVTALFGAVASYDLLVTADLALSAWCAFLLLRRQVRPAAAVVGGAFYGFSPFLLSQAPSHAKVAFAVFPPLLLLLLDRLLVGHDLAPRRAGLLLGLLVAAQLLVFEEGVALGLVAGVVVLGVLAARAGRARAREELPRLLRALGWAVLPVLVVAAVPLGFQLFGANRVPATVPGGSVYVTDVANLVVPTPTQVVAPPAAQQLTERFSGNTVENASYLGVPLLLLAVAVAWRGRRRPLVAVASWCGALIALLSLGPQLHIGGHVSRLPLPWRAFQALPVIGDLLPSRLWVYVDLAVAVLLAVFVEDLLRAAARPLVRWAGAAATALVGVSLLPHAAAASVVEVPPLFDAPLAGVAAGTTVLVAPYSHDGFSVEAMVWQAAAQMSFRMPEGYFVGVGADGRRSDGPPPTTTSTVMSDIAAGGGLASVGVDGGILADLRRWRVGEVLVGPMPHQADMVRLFTRVLAAPPQRTGGVYVWTTPSAVASSSGKVAALGS
ncbi:MAG TPA: hypothetical protein VN193_17235 [Candidatus Angelobacter sp.]|jgi:hypothetical protein|nr:hypothetical protein [Candidatus Angelobacter sp.]